jgi:ABC-type phosphate transport system substrate-binding protein
VRPYAIILQEKIMSSFTKSLRNGSSALALSTLMLIGASAGQSAFAQAVPTTISDSLVGGGSTLASLALRQAFDCYAGVTVGTGTGADGYSFDAGFNAATPTPGLLPTDCTTAATPVEGLYAGVGSGNGLRAFITNRANQLFRGSVSATAATTVFLPAVPPQFIDNNNVNTTIFGQYPYPRIDFGASDSPLPSSLAGLTALSYATSPAANWESASSITATPDTTVAYNVAAFGQPIQLPLFEAPVTVAVNLPVVDPATATTTVGTTTWTINSQFSATAPGGRIQLSTAQVCAIFSGLVTDWASTATIPYLKADGTTDTQLFSDDNTYYAGSSVGAAGTGAGAYATSTAVPAGTPVAPISISYRSDGSGTSFIFTNYLKTVCPLLDPNDTYKYQSIFNKTNLPNNNFPNLIANVNAARGVTVTAATYNVDAAGNGHPWVGAAGNDAVAANIGTDPANTGRVGYLSNDFVAPYDKRSTAPASASLQNDYQRFAGVYHPGLWSTNFIAATPASADAAWSSGLPAASIVPETTWAYNDYNVYAKAYPAGATLPGSVATDTTPAVSIAGLSALPLAPDANAFPSVGTANIFLYSCYGAGADGTVASTRKGNLVAFLNWYYTNALAASVLTNNGFHALPADWTANINNEYLTNATASAIADTDFNAGNNGCAGATGAN